MTKLYAVTMELEIVVQADSDRHAGKVARDALHDFSFDEEPEPISVRRLLRGSPLPEGYELDSVPWGTDGDCSIGELLADQPDDELKGGAV